jgi:peptide deformylase
MALLTILKFPDVQLREISKAIQKVTPDLVKLSEDMLETMYHANGIGLAAPQVGELIRLVVIDIRRLKEAEDAEIDYDKDAEMTELEEKIKFPLVLFNPEIICTEGKTTYEEGCLSVPGFNETVKRAKLIEIKGLSAKNEVIQFKVDGLVSICLQHELDHLEGKLFIDRISTLKSDMIKSKIKKHGYPKKEKTEAM